MILTDFSCYYCDNKFDQPISQDNFSKWIWFDCQKCLASNYFNTDSKKIIYFKLILEKVEVSIYSQPYYNFCHTALNNLKIDRVLTSSEIKQYLNLMAFI